MVGGQIFGALDLLIKNGLKGSKQGPWGLNISGTIAIETFGLTGIKLPEKQYRQADTVCHRNAHGQ